MSGQREEGDCQDFEKVKAFMATNYGQELESVDPSVKGWNYGKTKFEGGAFLASYWSPELISLGLGFREVDGLQNGGQVRLRSPARQRQPVHDAEKRGDPLRLSRTEARVDDEVALDYGWLILSFNFGTA